MTDESVRLLQGPLGSRLKVPELARLPVSPCHDLKLCDRRGTKASTPSSSVCDGMVSYQSSFPSGSKGCTSDPVCPGERKALGRHDLEAIPSIHPMA